MGHTVRYRYEINSSCIDFINTFPNDKFSSKLKGFADDLFNFDENGRKFSKRVEITVGKGKLLAPPLPIVFSKDLYCRHVKSRACMGKG